MALAVSDDSPADAVHCVTAALDAVAVDDPKELPDLPEPEAVGVPNWVPKLLPDTALDDKLDREPASERVPERVSEPVSAGGGVANHVANHVPDEVPFCDGDNVTMDVSVADAVADGVLGPVLEVVGEGVWVAEMEGVLKHVGALLTLPAGHAEGQPQEMHIALELAPIAALYVPAGQSRQFSAPAKENEPWGQSIAVIELKGQ